MPRTTAVLMLIMVATASSSAAQVYCDVNGPYLGVVGEPIEFDGTGSISEGGTIVFYEWEFGDGTKGQGPMPTHTYTLAGSYTVTLVVTDDSNLSSSCREKATVTNEAPIEPASWGRIKAVYLSATLRVWRRK